MRIWPSSRTYGPRRRQQSALILTGPNMRGKHLSAPVALIVLLAQSGALAATEARTAWSIAFSPASALHNLTAGYSTFMMEMIEAPTS